jgi:hypothetical protein
MSLKYRTELCVTAFQPINSTSKRNRHGMYPFAATSTTTKENF